MDKQLQEIRSKLENHDEIKKGSLLYILREEMNHKIKGGLYHNIQIMKKLIQLLYYHLD